MNWYPWLNYPYQRIISCYQNDQGPHVLLLHSKKGNGEISLMYAIVRWLMCYQPNGIKSCNQCYSCHLMMIDSHPDYYYLAPDKVDHQTIGIDSIRIVINSIHFRPRQSRRKVVWIPYSNLLTDQSANALLKVLEELSDETYFLLGCRELSDLLPTFRSRCFYWALPVPKESLALQYLHSTGTVFDPQVVCTALRLCSGAIQAAEELLQPTRWKERLTLCATISNTITSRDMLLLLPLLNKSKDREPLNWLLSFLVDTYKWQQDIKTSLINSDMSNLVKTLASHWSMELMHVQWQKWLRFRRQSHEISGINHELLLTHYLLSWERDIIDHCV
ncbi:DNA polymerase III subunit delta' C-terminal domain-containing protein [Candidatus Curculioniphilus buchneri]|uniref:DNA polymerase III subunit delta' C-terminal domain-containing protein n=1 Tax=Candidatus Curculioniphilus buchneri TaxID=690594 RepID=UPI00376F27ED